MNSVAFSPGGTMLAAASGPVELGGGDVYLWRLNDGLRLVKLQPDAERYISAPRAVAFSPDGRILAAGGAPSEYGDGITQLWSTSDGKLLQTLVVEARPGPDSITVTSVAFSPNGEILATGTTDNIVRLWRVSDGTLLWRLAEHSNQVWDVSFSPDGQMLASASSDQTVRLWRTSNGVPLRVLQGDMEEMTSIAFSPDGAILAGGSADNTVRLWRVSDGALLRRLIGHTDTVRDVAFSPDGRFLASGSADMTVRLWGVY